MKIVAKLDEINFLMGVAELAAKRSKAVRLQVGAVVTDSKYNAVASGFNGTVRGFHTNTCEHVVNGELVTDDRITIHAEQNAIAHAARRGISIEGGVAVLTHSGCCKCTSLLIQCGIEEIYYKEKHRSFDEVMDLYRNHITIRQFKGY